MAKSGSGLSRHPDNLSGGVTWGKYWLFRGRGSFRGKIFGRQPRKGGLIRVGWSGGGIDSLTVKAYYADQVR